MSNYNLTDNVNDSFTFEVNGVAYSMRYPLVEQIEEMQDMVTATEDVQREIDRLKRENQETQGLEEKLRKQNEDLNDWMYTFIDPVKEDSPAIKETMKKMNVKVLQNFQTMFKTEFGIQ